MVLAGGWFRCHAIPSHLIWYVIESESKWKIKPTKIIPLLDNLCGLMFTMNNSL